MLYKFMYICSFISFKQEVMVINIGFVQKIVDVSVEYTQLLALHQLNHLCHVAVVQ